MTDLRTAAQQVLEALMDAQSNYALKHKETDDLIAALKAALAEPVQEMPSNTRYTVAVEGQAVTYWDNIHDAITNAQRAVYAGVDATIRAIDDLRAGRLAEWSYGFSAVRIYPPQQQAEPVQEPVAWMVYTEGGTSAYVTDLPNDLVGAYRALPLYTAPPQSKPLTDAEIDALVAPWWNSSAIAEVLASNHSAARAAGASVLRHVARAVERAHGIGGDA